jgi:hypothetical protein
LNKQTGGGVFVNKRTAIITTVIIIATLFLSCKKRPRTEYEVENNFAVQPGSGRTAKIVEYLDYTWKPSINIPPRIKKMTITEIGLGSMSDRWFTSVTIPNTVVSIMDFSFSGNFIREVNFPEKLTEIGAGSFMNNRLTGIVISDSVKRIGYRAFFNNPLQTIIIGGNVELGELSGHNTVNNEEWKYTAFEGTGFDEAYRENGRLAGTYTKVNGIWQFAPRPQE